MPGSDGPLYWSRVAKFDPVTLALDYEIEQETPRSSPLYMRLRTAVEGGGIVVSGPVDQENAEAVGSLLVSWPGGAPTVAVGGQNLPKTTFSSPLGHSNANRASDPNRGIFANYYGIPGMAGIYNHVYLYIVPNSQASWTDLLITDVVDPPNTGLKFATIGAGPIPDDAFSACLGDSVLVGGPNRDHDRFTPPLGRENLNVSTIYENFYITRLIDLTAHYDDNLDYECAPTYVTDGYNSNSFANGLLRTAHLRPPTFTTYFPRFPGWTKFVPQERFQP